MSLRSYWLRSDPNIAGLVDMSLRRNGYRAYQAADGATGRARITGFVEESRVFSLRSHSSARCTDPSLE